MTTALQQAFPDASIPNADIIRHMAEQAIVVVADLDAVASGEDFSIQPWAGICSLADGALFMYDAADTTSAHDGMTVIVVSGRRYILRTTQVFDGSVASLGDTAPPGSPSLGDAYVIGAAPSGDWAAKAKNVTQWTARGWVYRAPAQGMVFWVADEQTFYHYDATDTWTQGLPIGTIADGSITPIKLANPLAVMPVEDERSAPPGSVPAAGTAYIVGASPSGAFAGHTGEIAWSNGTSYAFISPFEGATVHKRDAGELYQYRSGAWAPAVVAASAQGFWSAESGSVNLGPVTGAEETVDTIALQGTAANMLLVQMTYVNASPNTGSSVTWAIEIYLDTETEPRATLYTRVTNNGDPAFTERATWSALVELPDSSAHNVHVKARATSGTLSALSFTDLHWHIQEWRPTA